MSDENNEKITPVNENIWYAQNTKVRACRLLYN